MHDLEGQPVDTGKDDVIPQPPVTRSQLPLASRRRVLDSSYPGSGGRGGRWVPYAFILPAVILALGVLVLPLAQGVISSFTDQSLAPRDWKFVGLDQYVALWSSPEFPTVVRNQLQWTIETVVAVTVSSLVVAILLNQNYRGRVFFRTIVLLPWAMPVITVTIVFSWLYQPSGGLLSYVFDAVGIRDVGFLADPRLALHFVALVAVWHALPFPVLYFLAGLQALDPDLDEAARLDGAGRLQIFFLIRLPQLMPVLKTVVLLETIWMFNQFPIIWILTQGGPAGSTQTLATLTYYQAFNLFQVGSASAVGTVMLLVLLVLGFAFARQTLRTLREGGH